MLLITCSMKEILHIIFPLSNLCSASYSQNSILDCYWFDPGWRSVHWFGVCHRIIGLSPAHFQISTKMLPCAAVELKSENGMGTRLCKSPKHTVLLNYSNNNIDCTDWLFIYHQDGHSLLCASLWDLLKVLVQLFSTQLVTHWSLNSSQNLWDYWWYEREREKERERGREGERERERAESMCTSVQSWILL